MLANDLFIAACVCARVLIMCQMLCMFVVLNFSLKHVKLRLSFEQNVILNHTSQSERHAMYSSNSFDAEYVLPRSGLRIIIDVISYVTISERLYFTLLTCSSVSNAMILPE